MAETVNFQVRVKVWLTRCRPGSAVQHHYGGRDPAVQARRRGATPATSRPHAPALGRLPSGERRGRRHALRRTRPRADRSRHVTVVEIGATRGATDDPHSCVDCGATGGGCDPGLDCRYSPTDVISRIDPMETLISHENRPRFPCPPVEFPRRLVQTFDESTEKAHSTSVYASDSYSTIFMWSHTATVSPS